MKPTSPGDSRRRSPLTDYSFHAGFGEWRSSWSSSDDDDRNRRRFHNFSREFLLEAARERAREMAVFSLVVIAAFWPVIYMIITVVKLLLHTRPPA
jgi:hypothetical protein